MQSHTVHDGSHTELTHTIGDIVTRLVAIDMGEASATGQVRTSQVSRATDEFWQIRSKCSDHILRCLTGGNTFCLLVESGDHRTCDFLPVSWQFTSHAALELSGFCRIFLGIGFELRVPLSFCLGTTIHSIPTVVDILWNNERIVRPANVLTGRSDFILTQCCAMTIM